MQEKEIWFQVYYVVNGYWRVVGGRGMPMQFRKREDAEYRRSLAIKAGATAAMIVQLEREVDTDYNVVIIHYSAVEENVSRETLIKADNAKRQ